MTQQPQSGQEADSVSAGPAALQRLIRRAIADAGGWLPFDRFMALALYAPGLGYYARGSRQFGTMPASGSDFVTAPELSPLFGAALACQVQQALDATATAEVWEFGAGSGALAAQLLRALGDRVQRYSIVDLSGALRQRQREALAPFGERVRWLDALPEAMARRDRRQRGARCDAGAAAALGRRAVVRARRRRRRRAAWPLPTAPPRCARRSMRPSCRAPPPRSTRRPRPSCARWPIASRAGPRSSSTTVSPTREYYLPERVGGTLMCHRAHLADTDPLADVGDKDITAHVNFSAIALAAQDAGFEVLGYTSQARFLLNCGIAPLLADAQRRGDWPAVAAAQKLLAEHEMGELFKVIGLVRGAAPFDAIGFAVGDRSHRL